MPVFASVPRSIGPCRRAAVATILAVAACAPAVERQPLAPAEIPAAEARLARDPADTQTRLELADAYRTTQRADAAVALLQPVLATVPAAASLLGLIREEQGDYAAARRLYDDYLARGRDPEVRRLVRDRLQLLSALELQAAVRYALSRERELAATTPQPAVVGVFPFLTVTEDPQLRPLGTALAELLTTDLAQTDRLRVVERVQVQALLDEIRLAESGRVDTATAARGGRLMGAGRIVQGRVEGGAGSLALQAAVVRVPRDTAGRRPLRESAPLDRIFDLEKRLALGIYEQLGIELTAAERERVLRQPTTSVQALIAFGFGLEAQDAGRHAEAAQHFARAAQIDPGFRMASERGTTASARARAAAVTPALLSQQLLQNFDGLLRAETFRALQELVPDPSRRDPAAEVIGTEGTSRRGTVEIIITRPGGGQ